MSLASAAFHCMEDLRRQDCQASLEIFLGRATFSNERIDFEKNCEHHQNLNFSQNQHLTKWKGVAEGRISRDEKPKHYLQAETYKRNFNNAIHNEARRQSEFVSKVGPRHEIRRPLYDLGLVQHEEKMPTRDSPRKDAEQRSV